MVESVYCAKVGMGTGVAAGVGTGLYYSAAVIAGLVALGLPITLPLVAQYAISASACAIGGALAGGALGFSSASAYNFLSPKVANLYRGLTADDAPLHNLILLPVGGALLGALTGLGIVCALFTVSAALIHYQAALILAGVGGAALGGWGGAAAAVFSTRSRIDHGAARLVRLGETADRVMTNLEGKVDTVLTSVGTKADTVLTNLGGKADTILDNAGGAINNILAVSNWAGLSQEVRVGLGTMGVLTLVWYCTSLLGPETFGHSSLTTFMSFLMVGSVVSCYQVKDFVSRTLRLREVAVSDTAPSI